jgi:O-antigen/teichoic acid export membrane protein
MESVAQLPKLAAAPAADATPVGTQAARGALWTILFSALNKAVTLGAQTALAWFLLPEDFGLVALTLSITSFASLICGSNLKNLLIQRSAKFDEEAGQVFWLSLTLNVTAALLLMLFSPLAGLLFRQPGVVPLILVAALATPLQALPTIYAASLNRQLRFRQIAAIHFGTGLVQNGSAVLLAWWGFGAYALVLPLLFMALFLAVAFRLAAGRIALSRPQPRRWCAMFSPVSWLMLNALFVSAQIYGANFVIGLTHASPAITGFYYWGFSVSSQAIFLLATNLQGVLFPILSKLNEDTARQLHALRKASQTLLAITAPVCALQILLAQPVIALLFRDRWLPSVPVVQWLSAALITQPLSLLASSMLLARGRFRRLAGTSGFAAVLLLAAAIAGAQYGDHSVIARFTSMALFVANGVAGWVVYREFGLGLKDLLGTVAAPVGLAAAAATVGRLVCGGGGSIYQVALAGLACLLTYAALLKVFLPQVLQDLVSRIWARTATRPPASAPSHWSASQRSEQARPRLIE